MSKVGSSTENTQLNMIWNDRNVTALLAMHLFLSGQTNQSNVCKRLTALTEKSIKLHSLALLKPEWAERCPHLHSSFLYALVENANTLWHGTNFLSCLRHVVKPFMGRQGRLWFISLQTLLVIEHHLRLTFFGYLCRLQQIPNGLCSRRPRPSWSPSWCLWWTWLSRSSTPSSTSLRFTPASADRSTLWSSG